MILDQASSHSTAPSATPATSLVTTSYTLGFDPESGLFTLEPAGIRQKYQEIIVTEEDTTIVISLSEGLTFPESPLQWLINTQSHPAVNLHASSIDITVSSPPEPFEVLGFTLSLNYTDSQTTINNLLTPYFFITSPTLGTPSQIDLEYNAANGQFTVMQDALNVHLAPQQLLVRIGRSTDNGQNQGGRTIFNLVTIGSEAQATFADPAVIFTDRAPEHVVGHPQSIAVDLPWNPQTGFGLSFVIEHQGVRIFSPDPIILDKEIGTNPPPPPSSERTS